MVSSPDQAAPAVQSPSQWWLYLAPLYIAWRMGWANRMPIMDCDEVYNYWEPLHYLQYGQGLQTWEYAPDYALRTYAYLVPLQLLSRVLCSVAPSLAPLLTTHSIGSDKLALFVVLRSTLAGLTACCELLFLTALCQQVAFGDSLTRQTLMRPSTTYVAALVLLTSAGMTHASGALLPSSSVMMLWLLAASAYMRHAFRLYCAVAVVATLCLGWPFGVVVFVPMGVDILLRKLHSSPVRLLLEVAVWTAIVQATVMYVDYSHYGMWTSPTLNIFQYNAQSGGDELYGIEPTSYYVKNLALNFNYVAFFGLLLLPISALLRYIGAARLPTSLVVVLGGPIYLWLTIVVPRPHKEERFLFPIYPALTVAAVLVVEQIWHLCCCFCLAVTGMNTTNENKRKARKTMQWLQHVWMIAFLPACLLSVSRSMALSKYYTAPLRVYAALPPVVRNDQANQMVVCTCGEWYRYPSSYYLPEGYQLGFLPSSFTGQLPKAFETGLGSRGGTNFNDENKEEKDRYVSSVNACDFIVELETSAEAECLLAMKDTEWTKIADEPYLDAAQTSSLHRIIYLPFLHKAKYLSYSLYAKQEEEKVRPLSRFSMCASVVE
jgi:alpha-1,2-mannosyltransferase